MTQRSYFADFLSSGADTRAGAMIRAASPRWLASRFLIALTVLSASAPLVAWAAGPASRTLLLDAALAGDKVIAVGERGTILISRDNAATWQESTTHATATLTGVSFADLSHGWVVGHDALILVTSDAGASWLQQWQGENPSDSFLDVLAIDARHVIAVGAYGFFAETKDAGRTWTRRKIQNDDYHLNRITRGPSGTLYIAGEHGTLLRSSDQGLTWMPIPTTYDGSFFGVLPLSPTGLLAYGLRGRAFRSDDDGKSWTAVAIDAPVLLATASRDGSGTVFLAGQARAILVSHDGGRTFPGRNEDVATGVAELIALPDGGLLAVGEAGATRIAITDRVNHSHSANAEPTKAHSLKP